MNTWTLEIISWQMGIGILIAALSVIIAYLFRIRNHLIAGCPVSRAHLTCDPGNEIAGYNSVLATINFGTEVSSVDFFERFVSSVGADVPGSIWRNRMRFVDGRMSWEEVGIWIPHEHLRVYSDIIPSGDVETIVSELMGSPLRLDRPCWEIIFLERVRENDRIFSTCILKYHHAMADGFTMLRHMLLRSYPVEFYPRRTGLDALPGVKKRSIKHRSYTLSSIFRSVFSVIARQSDNPSTFRASSSRYPGEQIHVAFSDMEGVTVERLKGITQSLRQNFQMQYTINDVLVAALTIAMRDFALSGRGTVCHGDLSAVVWVSLPQNENMEDLQCGNSGLGFATCALPLRIPKNDYLLETLKETQKRLAALKSSPEPVVINRALFLIGMLPVCLGKRISAIAADKASVSISNMAGPLEKLVWPVPPPSKRGSNVYPGSGIVDSVYFATSPPFRYGPLFSLLTYHGKVFVSVSARAELFSRLETSQLVNQYLLNAIIKMETSL